MPPRRWLVTTPRSRCGGQKQEAEGFEEPADGDAIAEDDASEDGDGEGEHDETTTSGSS